MTEPYFDFVPGWRCPCDMCNGTAEPPYEEPDDEEYERDDNGVLQGE